ncbi:NAD(P)-dependent oxidoreductase [Sphingomonas sp.]|jgi:nucleoside-diphosphate-sugar epimerase|uniref:NAD-dependent epimerase/dehydratase family protein n=1 Tax=Sphingomonas sp. TaxID=28214 RepID=UPI002EDA56ED
MAIKVALLTGATGFIGGQLTKKLVECGWTVHAIVRPGSDTAELAGHAKVHLHDGTTQGMIDIVRVAKPEVVFHLASLFLADHKPDQVEALVRSNVLFPAQLLEAMVQCGVTRLVNTGTGWQHYRGPEYDPVNLYSATKEAFEDIALYYHDAKKISAITLKLFDTYGRGDPRRKLLAILIDAARTGEPLAMSPGDQVIDLTHVSDVIAAFLIAADRLLATDNSLWESFFVSSDRMTVKQLVALTGKALGADIAASFGGRPYREREVMTLVDTKGRTPPGWSPARDLMEGIAEMAAS